MNIFNRTIAILVSLVFMYGLFPSWAFAQNRADPSPGSISGFNQSVFDYHFSRADREITPDRWLAEARRGIGLAINAWEIIAIDLFDTVFEKDDHKKRLEKWSEEELEYRFSQWLTQRFFGTESENLTRILSELTSDIHLRYTYHHDENGNLLFDEKTGDPRFVRIGDEGRDYAYDLEQWREDSRQNIADLYALIDSSVLSMYPQLLSFIHVEERDVFENALTRSILSVSSMLKTEFENIVAREERLFDGRRAGSNYSLKFRSDAEESQYIVASLINQAQAVCNTGIAELQTRIEEAENGEGDLVLMGTEWLEMYREQFERGLKIWEEAEERFFIRRIEWEQESFRLFEQGEDAWILAFNRLEEERQKWELQAKELFESGEALFKQASVNLELAIAEARIEFENNLQLRTESGASKAMALIDMYFTCVNAAGAAKENTLYWLNLYDSSNTVDVSSVDMNEWIKLEKEKIWKKLEEKYTSTILEKQTELLEKLINSKLYDVSGYAYLDEIQASYDIYLSFYQKSLEMRENLIYGFDGIFGSGTLKGILDDNYSSDDFILDEYQNALVKAKLQVKYWEQRTEIAKAVSFYTDELESGRMTYADSLLLWENAKAAYEASVAAYEEEMRKLNNIGTEIQDKTVALDVYLQQMNKTAYELERLNAEYVNLLIVNSLDDKNILKDELAYKYSEILLEYKFLITTDFYQREIEIANKIENLQKKYTIDLILDVLVNGNEDMPSLAVLTDNVSKITIIDDGKTILESCVDYGIDATDTRGILINAMIDEYTNKYSALMTDADNAVTIEELTGYYNAIIRDLCYAYMKEAETILAIREMEIKLFSDNGGVDARNSASNYGSADWYSEAWNIALSNEEKEKIVGYQLGERLLNDYLEKHDKLIEKRLLLEMEALDYIINGNDSASSEIKLLADYCMVDTDAAIDAFAVLSLLSARIQNNENYTNGNDEIDAIIGWFISGGSFFSVSDMFLTDEFNEYLYAKGLYDAFIGFAIDCRFLEKEEWEILPQRLTEIFAQYNIVLDNPHTYLPPIYMVSYELISSPVDLIQRASLLFMELDNAFFFVPSWMKDEIDEWKNYVINQTIILSIIECGNTVISGISAEYYEKEIKSIDNEIAEFSKMFDSIIASDIKKTMDMNDAYNKLIEKKMQLLYNYVFSLMYDETVEYLNGSDDHWRMFIDSQYLENFDIEATTENLYGYLYDVADWSVVIDTRVKNAFAVYSNEVDIDENDNPNVLILTYLYESEKNMIHINNYEMLKSEIASIGKNLDYSLKGFDEKMDDLQEKQRDIREMENLYGDMNLEYLALSRSMADIGLIYNVQYAELKNAYALMEEKKHEYEIQDAVRRWASTAYLDYETDEVGYCENKLQKAITAQNMLANLYSDYEEQRMYNNSDYEKLLSEYEESYMHMLIGSKAAAILDSDLAKEVEKSNTLFRQLINELYTFGGFFDYSLGYTYPDDRSNLVIKDMITVNDGKLAFAMDSNFIMDEFDQANVEKLAEYFSSSGNAGLNEKAEFLHEIEELASRMAKYFENPDRMDQWGLARDYLIGNIAASNQDIKYLEGLIVRSEVSPGGSLANYYYQEGLTKGKDKIGDYITSSQSYFKSLQAQAWNSLSSEEKADLEFYVILTLNHSNDYNTGFTQFTALNELQRAYNKVYEHYKYANERSNWFLIGFIFNEMRDLNKATMGRINKSKTDTLSLVNEWKNGVINNISKIQFYSLEYSKSQNMIDVLQGEIQGNNAVTWPDIKKVLNGKLDKEELELLETLWSEMEKEKSVEFTSVAVGVSSLASWLKEKNDKCKSMLNTQWEKDYYERLLKEQAYFEIMDAYMNGDADVSVLAVAMEETYGEHTASWKTHYQNIEQTVLNSLTQYHLWGTDYSDVFYSMANEYVEIITNSICMGLLAELEAREAEWDIQRLDIIEKSNAWQESARLILERGRNDWDSNAQKMMDSYKKWKENFNEEYERISHSWNEAYLEGLEDKAQWLERAADAANNAMSGAMLSAIGSEAERFSRIMDTREFGGLLSSDIAAEADNVLAQMLNSPGIAGMSSAFGAVNSMGNFGETYVRRGFNVSGFWDAGNAMLEAAIISREANMAIAERESRLLAVNARIAADQALKMLAENIDYVNENFRKNMDNTFIMQGQWDRNGNVYVKDIITGSTLFKPVLYDRKSVQGYNDFQIGPVNLKTRLDDAYLEGLEYYAIQLLIQNVHDEINMIVFEIFGDGVREKIYKLSDDLPDRYLDSGKFGEHIGYMPLMNPKGGKTKKEMFFDQGKGEIGRLMTEYFYWRNIDAMGVHEMELAPWDKRMWDDSGRIISSPSLRSITDTAIQIGVAVAGVVGAAYTGGASVAGAIAIIAAINSTDDLLFNVLDVTFNYKSLGEAGFDFGKALLINTVSAAGSSVFNGIQGVESGLFSGGLTKMAMDKGTNIVGQTMIKGGMAGIQTFTTGLVNNAINGINYTSGPGFGYSAEVFREGMKGTLINTASTITSGMVTGMFTSINTGNYMEKLDLHSNLSKNNVQTLNNMIGALAGQGVNYLLGEGFTLNLLNTSLFESLGLKTGGGNSGLLEFRIGNDGSKKLSIGTGGANVSPDTVLAAAKGAAVWGFNTITNIYMSQQDFNLNEIFNANESFGDSVQRRQIWRLLLGIDTLKVNDGGEYDAITKVDENGTRVVTLNGYHENMSLEEKARLAAFLGQEAYRDGYKTGEVDKYGNLVTEESSSNELTNAVIAYIDMANRISEDYWWFYLYNQDMLVDSIALQYARYTDQMDLFYDYVANTYNNDEDYRWRYVRTNGKFQNDPRYSNITLLDGKMSRQEIDRINRQPIDNAVRSVMEQMARDEGYTGDIESFIPANGMTLNNIRTSVMNDPKFRLDYGITLDLVPYYSLGNSGCVVFSLMYMLEALTNNNYDPIEFNQWLVSSGYVTNGSQVLSADIMETVIKDVVGTNYGIIRTTVNNPDSDLMLILSRSSEEYIGHIRLNGANHSVVINSVSYTYDERGVPNGVSGVYVANPLNGSGYYQAQKYYSLNNIARLDYYMIIPTMTYEQFMNGGNNTINIRETVRLVF